MLNKNVNSQTEELGEIKKQVQGLKSDISQLQVEKIKLQYKQIDQEGRSRRDNLIFYGVSEERDENVSDKICSFLKEKMEISDGSTIIDRAHCLGKPKTGTYLGKDKPRQIIVKFFRFKEKERVCAKRFDLALPYSVSEDLPVEICEARKSLFPSFKN